MTDTTLQEAAQLALDAFTEVYYTDATIPPKQKAALHCLRQALALFAFERVPYGWVIAGSHYIYRGEYAEVDTKAEAKRIGGTCCAFPVFTQP